MLATCPSHDDLEHFSLGRIPEGQAQGVEEHLTCCPACLDTIQGLRVEDTLVEAVRHQPAARAKLPQDETVARTIGLLKGLQGSVTSRHLAVEQLLRLIEPPQGPDEVGRLGPYRILRVLGSGGMGIVLLGEDPQLGRQVAIKVLSPLLAEVDGPRKRFLREARAVAGIRHPNVVEVYHVGEAGRLPYFVMPYLEGESLETRLRRESRLPAAEVIRIGRELGKGLAAAHQESLLHRDVKPGNVWLTAPDGGVKLLDFGLSWVADDGERVTESGTVIGTPAYMSPEQARGDRADARSDLFAFGSVLYAMCAGCDPFSGESLYTILEQVRAAMPRPVRELNPAIPPGLAAVIARLHAKDPARRFASAAEVLGALDKVDGRPARKGGSKLYRYRFLAMAASVLAVAFSVAYLLGGAFDGPSPRQGTNKAAAGVAGQNPAGAALNQAGEKEEAKAPIVYPAALFAFEERGAGAKDYGPKVADLLFARLAVKPELYLVDRADLKKIQGELELGLSGVVKTGEAAKVGQLTGAKLLISGSVIVADKRIYLVGKIVGTETSRLLAASVEGKATDELAPLVSKLADQIAAQVRDQGDKLVARHATRADRLANLKRVLKKGPRPTVMVVVSERHIGAIRIDPAAQTEIMHLCKETGFPVEDPDTGLRARADVLLLGEAVSELATRNGGLVSVKARVELRAVDRKTDKVLASDRQTSIVVDLSEQIAGKAAIAEAAGILAERMLPKLVKE
jgi:TolB-like protein